MKYATISANNGSFKVEAEHGTDLVAAHIFFSNMEKNLWGAIKGGETVDAIIQIVDSSMNVIESKHISPIIEPVE